MSDGSDLCVHGEIRAACLDCLHEPQPLRATPARAKPPTTSPRSSEDSIRPLSGDKDVSVPVYDVAPYVDERTDWLIAPGYPHSLRPGGWVYLRVNDHLEARVRVLGVLWRVERPWRTSNDTDGTEGPGPGLVFQLDPATWERCDHDLGERAESQRQGYRYLITRSDDTIEHLMADDDVTPET